MIVFIEKAHSTCVQITNHQEKTSCLATEPAEFLLYSFYILHYFVPAFEQQLSEA